MAGDPGLTMKKKPDKPETELRREINTLGKELSRFANAIVNCFFALTREGSQRRFLILISSFIFLLLAAGISNRNLAELIGHLRNLWFATTNPVVAESFSVDPVQEFGRFLFSTYFSRTTLQFLILTIIPFVVAWQLAALYLADIFELEKIGVASNFIMHASLLGASAKLRIREGEIAPDNKDSPAAKIGGPGKVTVEMDSAALFEQPDGRPFVVGPTTDKPFVLDGFERFRSASILLRDLRTETMDVSSRSLDGIDVQAVGVSFLFSVDRARITPTPERPYPYRNSSTIESLTYGLTASVSRSNPKGAAIPQDWFGTMTVLIRGELARFMSEHNLTDYLASYGIPEVQAAREQAAAVRKAVQSSMPPEAQNGNQSDDDSPPPFISRLNIKQSLFSQFAVGFTSTAAQRGVELRWVGIGSWKTPNNIVPEQHLEAWKLTMENQARREEGAPDHRAQHVKEFIRDVPFRRFEQARQKPHTHRDVMIAMLVGYREQFMKILYMTEKRGGAFDKDSIATIQNALRHINNILGYTEDFDAHWVGGNGENPPSPAEEDNSPPKLPSPPQAGAGGRSHYAYTQEEQKEFARLSQKVRTVETAERLLEQERRRDPNASEIELIRRVIYHWDRENQ